MPYEKRGRFWSVTDAAGEMVCLAVYKKGAQEVLRRLDHVAAPATKAAPGPTTTTKRPTRRTRKEKTEMAYPTEMTLTSGTVAYAADPDSDERIKSREVRVSVTFQVGDDEADLADLAHVKMAEVERARLAAQDRIERDCRDPYDGSSPFDPTLEPPGEEDSCPFPEEADYLIAHGGPACNGNEEYNGCRICNGGHGRNGNHAPATATRAAPPWTPPIESEKVTPETEKVTPPETDWATRPQVLALGSHFRRLGLSPQDQTALLRERFGKFRAERLTKDEAAQLMRALERGELEAKPAGPSAVSADGRRNTVPA